MCLLFWAGLVATHAAGHARTYTRAPNGAAQFWGADVSPRLARRVKGRMAKEVISGRGGSRGLSPSIYCPQHTEVGARASGGFAG